jgi:hypothetical protein
LAQGTIGKPVINSPYVEPARQGVVVDGQLKGDIEDRRRPSEFFAPVAKLMQVLAQ